MGGEHHSLDNPDAPRAGGRRLFALLSPRRLAASGRKHLFPDALPAAVLGGLGAVIASSLLCAAAGFIVLRMATPAIPQDGDLFALNRPPAYTFLDRNGNVAGRRGAIVGDPITLSAVPPYLPAAFLATEDRRFYQHGGLDGYGLLRAFFEDVKARRIVQGGSTITQQTVKVVFLTPDRTFARKIPEMAGALALERHLSKQQILELYLNRIYLGSGAYGVDGAAHVYFGKSARKVTLAEAAMLAALTRSPSAFSPRRDLAMAQMRAGLVLDAMVSAGAITRAQADEARRHPATVSDQRLNVAASYFFDVAVDEVRELTGGAGGDLLVATTLDPAMEGAARTALTTVLNQRGKASRAGQAALVAIGTDGAVRALIGGRDYAESSFNRATMALRQPGSAFKPFVYLTALEQGLSPWSVRSASVEGDYAPKNYGDKQWGPVTLAQALTNSINTVAINVENEVGAEAIVSVAQRLGIRSPLKSYQSLALGTSEVSLLELTAAYASFASAGFKAEPYTVVEVRNGAGDVLYRRAPPQPQRVVDEDKALAMNAMLYDVVREGTGRAAAVPGHEVAGKTGTSSDFHDAWFIGYSADLVAGVWVGNDDSSSMKKVTGGSLPAQIWSGFMRQALATMPATPLPRAFPATMPDADVFASVDDDASQAEQRTVDRNGQDGTITFLPDGNPEERDIARHAPSVPLPPERERPAPPHDAFRDRDNGPVIYSGPPDDPGGVRDLEEERQMMAARERARAERQRDGRRDEMPFPDQSFYPGRELREPRWPFSRDAFPDEPEDTMGPPPRSTRPPRLVIRPDGTWETMQ